MTDGRRVEKKKKENVEKKRWNEVTHSLYSGSASIRTVSSHQMYHTIGYVALPLSFVCVWASIHYESSS